MQRLNGLLQRMSSFDKAPPTGTRVPSPRSETSEDILRGRQLTALAFLPDTANLISNKQLPRTWLCRFSVVPATHPDRGLAVTKVIDGDPTTSCSNESRALGCLMGLIVGDALGAQLEFHSIKYDKQRIRAFPSEGTQIGDGLKPGQWTDDSSMALCLADSLLVGFTEIAQELRPSCPEAALRPRDLRTRFLNWWVHGYNNAFGQDPQYPRGRESIGLGRGIGLSFQDFQHSEGKRQQTLSGNRRSSGNGSIMRLAPVSVFLWDKTEAAMKAAKAQSLTTHQGEEAWDCARLLAYVCTKLIQVDGTCPKERWKAVIGQLPDFPDEIESVGCLARSETETKELAKLSKSCQADRDWNWMAEDFRYSRNRAAKQPKYIGSYAMDCLAMALHCVHSTDSFESALLKACNLGGDADTVGAVTGQIAGALYGVNDIPKVWKETVLKWDPKGDIPLRAYLLFHRKALSED